MIYDTLFLNMLIFISLLIGLIAIFSNALFYTISLLIFSISFMAWIVYSNVMRTLVFLLMVIVYVGAIIILIGYICAVCPNFNLTPSFSFAPVLLFLLFSSLVLDPLNKFFTERAKSGALLDYFFRDWGSFMFIIIAIMLFFTLLIVTSQYMSPQGPFRSLS